ncbi:MAG: VWA domain-containing protein, partial [Acidobacteriaceae bacterium]|nr:VWA domain-containing protein [Acidobacteriaceae bacterium]
MTVRIALLAPLVLSLWPAPALPQTPPATAIPNPQSPRIVTKVEEVSLDLVVRNKKGKLVSDLNPADLEILDGGAPAKISDLHLVNGSPSGSIVTLVFDPLEAAAARQARDAALQLLKLAPASSISFAVLEVQGRLRLFQEFTSNRESLKRAIDAATGMIKTNPEKESAAAEKQLIQTARGASEAPSRTLAQVTLTALEQSPHIARDQHTKPSMSGLLALARAQQRLAGRKAIVYFAQGLTLDSSGKDLLKSVISAANRAGLSIYAVDVNGLDSKASEGLMAALTMASAVQAAGPSASNSLQRGGAPPSTDDVLVTPGMRTNIDEQMGRIEMSGLAPDQNSLSNLSASTGGIYIPGVENPRKSLRRMLEDLTSYYEVSYVPATPDDGRFRNVTVKPRHSGLIVRAPRGYYALVSGGSPIRPFEEPLLKALAAPQLPSNLQFRSAVLHFGETAFGNANSLVVEVPLSEVEIRDDQNTNLFAAHISILAQIRNTSGAIVEHFSEDIPRQGALEAEEQAQLETLTMQRHFTADSGQYVLETVVMDHNSGKLSAKRAAFEIPAASAGPALSDVLLVQRTQPLSADADPTEPLRYENALVIPNLSGRVPRDAKNVSLFFL